jgi:hypothetical protein
MACGVDHGQAADLRLGEELRNLLVRRVDADGHDVACHLVLNCAASHRFLASGFRTIAIEAFESGLEDEIDITPPRGSSRR